MFSVSASPFAGSETSASEASVSGSASVSASVSGSAASVSSAASVAALVSSAFRLFYLLLALFHIVLCFRTSAVSSGTVVSFSSSVDLQHFQLSLQLLPQ